MIKRKEGKCKCGYEGYLYAKGMCKNCYWEHRAEAKKSKPVKKALPKHKKKPTGEAALFSALWHSRPQVSFLTGDDLSWIKEGSKLWFSIFSHVLPKGRYKEFRLYDQNIIFLNPYDRGVCQHYLFDHGTEKQRDDYAKRRGCDWGKVFALRDKLLIEYEDKYKKNGR